MLDRLKDEAQGVVDTLATIGSSMVATPAANLTAATKDLLGHYDAENKQAKAAKERELKDYTDWLKENEHAKDTLEYGIVRKYVEDERDKVRVVTPESDAEQMIQDWTWEPGSETGKRNMEAIGEGMEFIMEDAKIPPLIPGISGPIHPATRPNVKIKGLPKTRTVKPRTQVKMHSDAIKERARTSFKDAKGDQVRFSPDAMTKLADRMEAELSALNVSKDSKHGRSAMQVINKIRNRAKSGDISIDELMEYQDLTNDIIKVGVDKSKNLATNMSRTVDDFIMNADELIITNGTEESIAAFNRGRKLWGKAKRTEDLEDMLESILVRKGKGIDDIDSVVSEMQAKVAQLLTNKKKSKFYTAEERAILRRFVEKGDIDRLLGGLESLDPFNGGGLSNIIAGVGTGAITGDPSTGVLAGGSLAAIGNAATKAKEIRNKGKIDKLIRDVQNIDTTVTPGFKQIDIPTDLGLLVPPLLDRPEEDEAVVEHIEGGLL